MSDSDDLDDEQVGTEGAGEETKAAEVENAREIVEDFLVGWDPEHKKAWRMNPLKPKATKEYTTDLCLDSERVEARWADGFASYIEMSRVEFETMTSPQCAAASGSRSSTARASEAREKKEKKEKAKKEKKEIVGKSKRKSMGLLHEVETTKGVLRVQRLKDRNELLVLRADGVWKCQIRADLCGTELETLDIMKQMCDEIKSGDLDSDMKEKLYARRDEIIKLKTGMTIKVRKKPAAPRTPPTRRPPVPSPREDNEDLGAAESAADASSEVEVCAVIAAPDLPSFV